MLYGMLAVPSWWKLILWNTSSHSAMALQTMEAVMVFRPPSIYLPFSAAPTTTLSTMTISPLVNNIFLFWGHAGGGSFHSQDFGILVSHPIRLIVCGNVDQLWLIHCKCLLHFCLIYTGDINMLLWIFNNLHPQAIWQQTIWMTHWPGTTGTMVLWRTWHLVLCIMCGSTSLVR